VSDDGWAPPGEGPAPTPPPPGQWAPTPPPVGQGHLPPPGSGQLSPPFTPGGAAPGQGSPFGVGPQRPSDAPLGPDDEPPRRNRAWVVVLLAGLLVVVTIGALAYWALNDLVQTFDPDPTEDPYELSGEELFPDDVPEDPPSERGQLPATSVPAVVDRPNEEAPAATSGEQYRQLDCQFTGEAVLEPGIGGAASRQEMRLLPGASFDCRDGTDRSSGVIELDATFDELGGTAGVGSGTGKISWREIAPSAPQGAPGSVESTTGVEIQLELPVIVVWTTILDGPYTGFNGRLVLRDWEPVMDGQGRIVGVRFARTSTTFGPT
jgi:hypothetical protein